MAEVITHPPTKHVWRKHAGQAITRPITPFTRGSNHAPPPFFIRGARCPDIQTRTNLTPSSGARWHTAHMPGAPARNRRLRVNLDPDGVFPTKCRAVTKNGPCRRSPVIGSPVCRSHGAAAPHVRAAADQRVTNLAAERMMRSMLLNLDAEPIRDPAAALMRLAARFESGFEETAKRINAAIDAGGEPSETDVALLRILGREARTVVTDMTRLQVGVQLASRYGTEQADVEAVIEGVVPELPDAPDVSAIVARVLATEHELETERLVRVEQAKQGQLPAGLTVVGETEQAS